MDNIDISFSGKYNSLLNGFIYRNNRKNPGYDWISKVNVEDIAASIDILDPDYDEKLKEALVNAYKEEILKPKDLTLGWYDYQELADSVQ
jgi:hypothetical protein